MKFSNDEGIAIGPILLVIAILAILAAAIAASSGTFSGSTNQENAKVMAQAVLDRMATIDMAVQQIKINNGYSDSAIGFTIPARTFLFQDASDASNSSLNSYNCTTSPCSVFDINGGGIIPSPLPAGVFDINALLQNEYGSLCTVNDNASCRWNLAASNMTPMIIKGRAETNTNVYWGIVLPFIDIDVCRKINDLTGFPNPSGNPPVLGTDVSLGSDVLPPDWPTGYYYPTVLRGTNTTNAKLMYGRKYFCFYSPGQLLEPGGSIATSSGTNPYNYVHQFY